MNRRQELVVLATTALLVLAGLSLLLLRPTRQAVAEAHADRDAAVAESQTLRDQVRALEALKADEAKLQAQARLARSEFPPTPSLPALVDALQDAASQAGVDLGSVAPSTPKTSTVQPELAQIDTSVSVSGGYFEIEDFLARVENLVKRDDRGRVTPRSVLVQSVDMSGGAGGTTAGGSASSAAGGSVSADELKATITLAVFQRVVSSGAPAAGSAAAGQTTQVR
jgi:Tfp pilus assembly protein PilO